MATLFGESDIDALTSKVRSLHVRKDMAPEERLEALRRLKERMSQDIDEAGTALLNRVIAKETAELAESKKT